MCEAFHGYLMYVFHEFLTSWRGILSFSRALIDYLCTTPCTLDVTILRGLIFHLAIFNIWMRRLCLIFFPLLGLRILPHICIWHSGLLCRNTHLSKGIFYIKGLWCQLQVCVWTHHHDSYKKTCALMHIYGHFVSSSLFGFVTMENLQCLRS